MGRRFGQHFLASQSALARIASALGDTRQQCLVEIGPGRGALTSHLFTRAEKVIAIEVDPVLAQYLRGKFRDEPKLEVVENDILKVDLRAFGPISVVGNLPYYITSPIVEKVLSLGALLQRAVFLVQKEVAERLTAAPGSRDYGYLSVQTQLLAHAELLFAVPSTAFKPPPKVESAVVRLTPREVTGVDDVAGFLKFAGLCFRHKRKTLRNNLLGAYRKELLDGLPEGGLRAEQVPIPGLVEIYSRLVHSEAPITSA